MSYEPRCAICEQPVNLEESQTEEHGHAVHENCYVWTVQLKKPGRRKNQNVRPSTIANHPCLRTELQRRSAEGQLAPALIADPTLQFRPEQSTQASASNRRDQATGSTDLRFVG